MKSKTYVKVFLSVVCIMLFLSCSAVLVLDPYFHYHAPWFGLEPVIDSERYQGPGMADHFDYDSLIVGSSLSQNFDGKWFDEAFDIKTLKLTYSAASLEEVKLNVERAESAHNDSLKYVFCNMGTNILDHTYRESGASLPEYLWDDDLLNDAGYLLNKNVLYDCAKLVANNLRGRITPVSQAFQWYQDRECAKENVLADIGNPTSFEKVEQDSRIEISENTRRAVRLLTDLAKEYPETQFYYFYSPNSIALWYDYYRQGTLLSELARLEYSMEELLAYDNVRLFFPSSYDVITRLDSYTDKYHYGIDIQYLIFEQMKNGENELKRDNYRQVVDDFRDMILGCDFERILS